MATESDIIINSNYHPERPPAGVSKIGQPYIGEDAAAGLIALYGLTKTAKEDVSVSHWRYGGKAEGGIGGFFSVHRRPRIFDADKQELAMTCPYAKPDLDGPLIFACPEPVYQVNKGQSVKLELTYENAGKTTPLAVKVHYYLSADNSINADDILLKADKLSLKRDSKPATVTTDLVIPDDVLTGKNYWLGCIVDADNAWDESFETNNATYVGITVK